MYKFSYTTDKIYLRIDRVVKTNIYISEHGFILRRGSNENRKSVIKITYFVLGRWKFVDLDRDVFPSW